MYPNLIFQLKSPWSKHSAWSLGDISWRGLTGSVFSCSGTFRIITRRYDKGICRMDGTVARHCIFRIIGSCLISGRECDKYCSGPYRAVRSWKLMGNRTNRSSYMIVAYFRRYRPFCKIFCIHGIASGVIGTDSCNSKFS